MSSTEEGDQAPTKPIFSEPATNSPSGDCPRTESDNDTSNQKPVEGNGKGGGSADCKKLLQSEVDHHRKDQHSQDVDIPAPLRACGLDRPTRRGWVIVVAAWILMTPIAGVFASFGNMIEPLSQEFNSTKLVIGLVGSTPFGLALGLCPFSLYLLTRFGTRPVCYVGALLWLAGLLLSSFVQNIYILFLTYSFLLGTGANFCFNPTMNLVGQYFPKKHAALATCLATAGISTGSLAMNPILDIALKGLGWRVTFRVLSVVIFSIQIICFYFYLPPPPPPMSEPTNHVEKETEKQKNEKATVKTVKAPSTLALCLNPGILLWMLGTLFWSVSFTFPLIFLVDYMKKSLGVESSKGNLVLMVYGIAELAGRFFGGFIADRARFSLTFIYAFFCSAAGIFTLLTPAVQNFTMMFFYGTVCGMTSGVVNALMFATSMKLFGRDCGNHIWGYINVMLAVGAVSGPSVAGAVYDLTNSYQIPFQIGGSLFLASGITMLLIEPARKKYPLRRGEGSERACAAAEDSVPLRAV